ncbi:MAG: type II toxin-antitoxin system HicA family toxin [Clostridia bacterium]|nr:type II toxin-antitoxin system HicA family toxin [Clostridia bacterium]
MNRRDVIKRLEANGWYFKRAGHDHDIYWSDKARRPVPVKRHREIPDREAHRIFKESGLE